MRHPIALQNGHATLDPETTFLRSKYFFRHQYQRPSINYGFYGNYGRITNIAITAVSPELPS